jgi:1,4-alpha-glucan branching enzyme
MPGDDWQKMANLRLLLAYMYAQPAKKLLFMGGELGQWREWNHDASLDWHLLAQPLHAGVQRFLGDLNRLYREEPALHELDADSAGFEWIDCQDSENGVLLLLRRARAGAPPLVAALNFTPVARTAYRVGVPLGGFWWEVLNSDAEAYGGSGQGNLGGQEASAEPAHGRPHSLTLVLPPLGAVFLRAGHGAP